MSKEQHKLRDLIAVAMENDEPFIFAKLVKPDVEGASYGIGHIVLSSADRFSAQKLLRIVSDHLKETTGCDRPISRFRPHK